MGLQSLMFQRVNEAKEPQVQGQLILRKFGYPFQLSQTFSLEAK